MLEKLGLSYLGLFILVITHVLAAAGGYLLCRNSPKHSADIEKAFNEGVKAGKDMLQKVKK